MLATIIITAFLFSISRFGRFEFEHLSSPASSLSPSSLPPPSASLVLAQPILLATFNVAAVVVGLGMVLTISPLAAAALTLAVPSLLPIFSFDIFQVVLFWPSLRSARL